MKSSDINVIRIFSFISIAVALLIVIPAGATVLTYDAAENPGWFADDAWGVGEDPEDFDTNWSNVEPPYSSRLLQNPHDSAPASLQPCQ